MHCNCDDFGYAIHFDLKNVDCLHIKQESQYPLIISPFSRMYLVTQGHGWVLGDGHKTPLEPGYLYLIPSFSLYSYSFSKDFIHYYIHFSTRLINGLNVYSLYRTADRVSALPIDEILMERLIALNPCLKIPHHDPAVYQAKEWMNKKIQYRSAAHFNENRGIMDQLFSRFIIDEEVPCMNEMVRYNMNRILNYIQMSLSEPISVEHLAMMACLSTDHFIRVFKKMTSYSPCEFIIRKRIEKAQLMLLTTNLPIKQIIEVAGFKSLSYFSRIFKKYTSFSPLEYRKHR